MSSEVIEAVFRFSEKENTPLMLIASKNQIDWDGGYVNNWTTKQYVERIGKFKKQYPKANVYLCRDHCGPGFKNNDLADVYKTIDSDIENGFDLIHIDFCHHNGTREEILKESKKAIEYIRKNNPDILIEVGTEENRGEFLYDVSAVEREMTFFKQVAPIHFFTVQTGSLVKEINQVGKFNREFMEEIRQSADENNLNLKEHNADYLTEGEILGRKNLIDSMNIAPQFGVVQTQLTLEKAKNYGIDASDFLNAAYESGKWKKWLHTNTPDNRLLCSVIAGHYVFSSDEYKKLYDKINRDENFRETVIQEMMKIFKIYLDNL